VNWYIKLGIWVAVVGAAFLYLWRKGYIQRVRNYVAETREELRKCTWPNAQELKGSTVVVLVALALLGAFTVGIDLVFQNLMQILLKL
jgi:preprotein translocase subunit SecE